MEKPIRKLFLCLIIVTSVLLLMNLFPKEISPTIHDRFDLNEEANVPTWFSTVLLFSISFASFLIYKLDPDSAPLGHRPRFIARNFWLIFAIFYCYLSLDELARFHELIDRYTDVKWVLVYLPISGLFFVMTVYYFLRVRRADRAVGCWVLGGLVIYAAGGMGAEMIQHIFNLSKWLFRLEVMLEEGMEMTGSVIVLTGVLSELANIHNAYQGNR